MSTGGQGGPPRRFSGRALVVTGAAALAAWYAASIQTPPTMTSFGLGRLTSMKSSISVSESGKVTFLRSERPFANVSLAASAATLSVAADILPCGS